MSASLFANSPAALGAPRGRGDRCRRRSRRRSAGSTRGARSTAAGSRSHTEALRWSCYREIPALSKREIVETGHQSFFPDYREVERGLADRRFEYENTSGTTAAPMTVIMEDGWWAAQTRRAYRASADPARVRGPAAPQVRAGPGGVLEQPLPLRGPPVPAPLFRRDGVPEPLERPLRLLRGGVGPDRRRAPGDPAGDPRGRARLPLAPRARGRAARRQGAEHPRRHPDLRQGEPRSTAGGSPRRSPPRRSTSTARPRPATSSSARRSGTTPGSIDDNAFIELAPWRAGRARRPPDLRDDPGPGGDAAPALPHGRHRARRCPAGFRILGRERDLYLRPDGTLVSAADVDAALPADFACWHYCLTQTGAEPLGLPLRRGQDRPPRGASRRRSRASSAPGVRVNAFRRKSIAPAASGKFALLKPLAPAWQPGSRRAKAR